MKMFLAFCCLTISATAFSATEYGYLKKEDQQYYKNDSQDGNNQRERIDSSVKEINKLHGEMALMKAEILKLKQDVEQLKSAKK
ncbi:MAG: hypothetical protein H0V66_13460 [Bdellovibrionales bacterium]|nr:hypothetical protein [Bdellovibrionales bacterium]